jgi:hypothetical protein
MHRGGFYIGKYIPTFLSRIRRKFDPGKLFKEDPFGIF